MKNTMYDDPQFCPWCGGSKLDISGDVLYNNDSVDEITIYYRGSLCYFHLSNVRCVDCGESFVVYREVGSW